MLHILQPLKDHHALCSQAHPDPNWHQQQVQGHNGAFWVVPSSLQFGLPLVTLIKVLIDLCLCFFYFSKYKKVQLGKVRLVYTVGRW